MIMEINNLIEAIIKILKNKFSSLMGVYLFGSGISNTTISNSDYDLAFIFMKM